MNNHLKVEGHDNLYRDPKTNSIINKNTNQYNEYVSQREAKNEEEQKIQNLESDFATIRGELDEIKSLLKEFINESR
jgi:hypothetical protein